MTVIQPAAHISATPAPLSPAAVASHAATVAVAATTPPALSADVAAEVNRIEAALSLALHSVQTQYDADVVKVKAEAAKLVADVKSTWNAVKANVGKLIASHSAAAGVGAGALAVIKHFL